MATRTRLERCQWCSNQLAVPVHLQTVTCPVCRRTNRLAPPTNNGIYQQQPASRPTGMYNNGFNPRPSRLPTFNRQQSMPPQANSGDNSPPPAGMYNNGFSQRPTRLPTFNRQQSMPAQVNTGDNSPPPVGMYNNGFSQRPTRLPTFNHQQSMRPQENTDDIPPSPGGMYNNGFSQRPTRLPTFNHQQSLRPSSNYNSGDDDALIPNNGSYNQQASVPPRNNNNSNGYNHQVSIPPMNNNGAQNTHVSPRPMSNNGGYNPQLPIPPVNNNGGYNNQISPRPMNNNGGYNQVSVPPVNRNNDGYNNQVSPNSNSYHRQESLAPPINNNTGNYNHGKKKAVLCGISYMNTVHSLDGSISDVESVKSLLVNTMGFPNSSILVLTELEPNSMRIPTLQNITAALRWLVQGCQSGDSLVFYYTGHGSRVADDGDDEYDGFDEALCPLDYKTAGKLLDDEMNELIVRPLPKGVQLLTIIDTCHSGTALDLSYISRSNSRGKYFWEDHESSNSKYQGTNGGLAICISACDDHQKSGNTTAFTGTPTGALTYSLVKALRSEPTSTYGRLINNMRTEISSVQSGLTLNGSTKAASTQEPQLSSSEKFDIYTKKILL